MIRHIARIVVLKLVLIAAVLSMGIFNGCAAGGASESPFEALAQVKQLDLTNIFEAWLADIAGMERLDEVTQQLQQQQQQQF